MAMCGAGISLYARVNVVFRGETQKKAPNNGALVIILTQIYGGVMKTLPSVKGRL